MFFPDSIILKAFTEDFVKQYLVKSERKDRQHFSLYFNAPNEKLPTVEALNFSFDEKVFIQSNNRKDSITYWLKDSLTWSVDTLKLRVHLLPLSGGARRQGFNEAVHGCFGSAGRGGFG